MRRWSSPIKRCKITCKMNSRSTRRDDRDIAAAIVEAVRWDVTVPAESINANVDEGFVILEGEADW